MSTAAWERSGSLCILAALSLVSALLAQTKVARSQILGFAHVAFRVSNLDKTQLFYEGLFGYQEPFSLNDGNGKTTIALRSQARTATAPSRRCSGDRYG